MTETALARMLVGDLDTPTTELLSSIFQFHLASWVLKEMSCRAARERARSRHRCGRAYGEDEVCKSHTRIVRVVAAP